MNKFTQEEKIKILKFLFSDRQKIDVEHNQQYNRGEYKNRLMRRWRARSYVMLLAGFYIKYSEIKFTKLQRKKRFLKFLDREDLDLKYLNFDAIVDCVVVEGEDVFVEEDITDVLRLLTTY